MNGRYKWYILCASDMLVAEKNCINWCTIGALIIVIKF